VSGGSPSQTPRGSEETKLARFVVGKVFELLLKILEGKNVLAGLIVFGVCFLGWVIMLPQDQRIHADPAAFAAAIAHVLGHGLFCLAGWLLAILLLAIGTPMFYLQHKRIRRQGASNIKLRQSQQSSRLSAGDVDALKNYPSDSAKRFNLNETKKDEEK
jgi:hypothetical protein